MPIQAAAYIRVSSEMQVEQGSSLPSQLSAISEFAAHNGFTVDQEHIYKDEGISARSDARPGFLEMISIAKRENPPFKAIICYESSRFARNREDAIVYKSLLRRRGIQVRFVKQDFDDSPMGKLMEGLAEIIDEWYSANFAIETKRGQTQNAKDGYSTGGRPPYGLRIGKILNEHGKLKSRWEPDPEKSEVVKRIYSDYIGGKGYNVIAQQLNSESIPSPSGGKWNKNTLHYILHKNQPAYLGNLIYGREKPKSKQGIGETKYNDQEDWVINKGVWEPIISKEDAQAAALKAIRHTKRKRTPDTDRRFLLTGKIYCGLCGASMVGSKSAKNHYYYRCNTRTLKGKESCSASLAGVVKIEEAVLGIIRNKICDEVFLKTAYKKGCSSKKENEASSKDSLKDVQKALDKADIKKNNIVRAVANGDIPSSDARAFMNEIQNEIDHLTLKLITTQQEQGRPNMKVDFGEFCAMLKQLVDLEGRDLQKMLFDAFISNVTVFPDKIEVLFSLPLREQTASLRKKREPVPSLKEETDPSLCIRLAERVLHQPRTQCGNFSVLISTKIKPNRKRK